MPNAETIHKEKGKSGEGFSTRDLRVTLQDERDATPPTFLDQAEKISRIVSAVAIPVVLALSGWAVQHTISSQTVSQEYVRIAVSILQAKDSDTSLREWAAKLLSECSPTPISDPAIAALSHGEALLPDSETLARMIREHRHALIDDFIVGSDAYTKTARRIFEDGAAESDVSLFKGDHIDNYNLQKARMKAYFGGVVVSQLAETDKLSDAVFELVKSQPNASREIWFPVIDAIIRKNKEITDTALESIKEPRVLKSWGMG